ncbi:MAG: signal recognition particle-docking protein FtsY [Candidatus Nanopelagicales bacterium]
MAFRFRRRPQLDETLPDVDQVVAEALAAVVPGADAASTSPLVTGTAAAPAAETAQAQVLGRMGRLRHRLSGGFGRGLLGVLTGGSISDDDWDHAEALLLQADLGLEGTERILRELKKAVREHGDVAGALKSLLLRELRTDRSLDLDLTGAPTVIMVVGVNGTGKTTTCGKLAALLVGLDQQVVLAAADTYRAAAAEQLATWGARTGALVIRGAERGDPASVAFDAVARGVAEGADVVIVDTAGRLHTKVGLMDELGKVGRVIEKLRPVDEVLLVLDATTGQNGLVQARVFAEAVRVTGVVLTKLDGTAKGGIVFAVQRELGVPVKFVGLGEGAEDLAPFDPEVFVESLVS